MLMDYVRLARPKEWVKNAFVLIPAPFAIASGTHPHPLSFAIGFLGFCLAASAIYANNDAQDAERDRAHATKRERPVASGRVSLSAARVYAVLLALAALLVESQSGSMAALTITAIYIMVNVFYSLVGKHIPLVDVFLLSSFYLLRVLLGCALLGVAPSNWLLLCTCAVALFIGFAKRRADLIKGLDGSHRPSLVGYNRTYVDQAIGITAGMTLVAYALYTMESKVLIAGREFASVPFVVFLILDYLRLVYVHDSGGAPVEVVLRSPSLLLCFAGWFVTTLWSLGLP
jgi:4-hydroxybenzoate polyprenyltransferase